MKIFLFFPLGSLNNNSTGRYGLKHTALLSIPDSTIVKNGNPVYIPDFDSRFVGRLYMAFKVSRLGKSVAPRFASRYFDALAPAICLTAENLLSELSADGLPWTKAIAFDKACVLGDFRDISEFRDNQLSFRSADTITGLNIPEISLIEDAISEASRDNTIKMGDLILIPVEGDLMRFDCEPDTLTEITLGNDVLLKLPLR